MLHKYVSGRLLRVVVFCVAVEGEKKTQCGQLLRTISDVPAHFAVFCGADLQTGISCTSCLRLAAFWLHPTTREEPDL